MHENTLIHNFNSQKQKKIWYYSWAIIIFIITFIFRALFIIESETILALKIPVPGMDIDLYWQASRLLHQGISVDKPCFELMMCSSPLYPHWLAFWQGVLGSSIFAHRLFNALLVSVSAVLIYRLALKMTHQIWIAIFIGLAWASMPSLIFFDAMLYKSSMGIMILIFLLMFVCSEKSSSLLSLYVLKGFFAALLFSVLFFLQSSAFLFLIPLVLYLSLDKRLEIKKRAALSASTVVGFLMVLLLFQMQNTNQEAKYPRYLPQKGVHMNIGFNEKADGTYVRLKALRP